MFLLRLCGAFAFQRRVAAVPLPSTFHITASWDGGNRGEHLFNVFVRDVEVKDKPAGAFVQRQDIDAVGRQVFGLGSMCIVGDRSVSGRLEQRDDVLEAVHSEGHR